MHCFTWSYAHLKFHLYLLSIDGAVRILLETQRICNVILTNTLVMLLYACLQETANSVITYNTFVL